MRCERGSVSAEFAVTLPAVLGILGLVLSALSLAGDQAWLTSASSWAAREVAMGGDERDVVSSVVVGHPGIESDVSLIDDQICVTLSRKPTGPLALLGISAVGRACARRAL